MPYFSLGIFAYKSLTVRSLQMPLTTQPNHNSQKWMAESFECPYGGEGAKIGQLHVLTLLYRVKFQGNRVPQQLIHTRYICMEAGCHNMHHFTQHQTIQGTCHGHAIVLAQLP